jgi:hypothetical protein
MDSLLSEGKIDESLFDSEGEISSEDVGLLVLLLTCLIFFYSHGCCFNAAASSCRFSVLYVVQSMLH